MKTPRRPIVPTRCLPGRPTACPQATCAYLKGGVCDDPRCNKGNGDAKCHRWSNRRLLETLGLRIPGSRPEPKGKDQ